MLNTLPKIALLVTLAIQLTACKPFISMMESLKNALLDIETQSVILSKTPTTITNQPTIYHPTEPLKVLGKDYDLCFALKDNYVNHSSEQNAKDFAKALNGSHINVSLTDQDGKLYNYPATTQRWSLYGELTGTGELSVCMSCGCKQPLAIGTNITQVYVSADKPLEILGSYWQSSNEEEKVAEKIEQKKQ